ncbi:hypothetical protein RCL_jg9954.t1 [Rhizophagus clarus]|uniref:Uncharacterized protein n=1 Tax=Rhizophagus clarus TaxID=94130 RepID=A0A8H3QES1_9GLOM|nr:hypothetical protein RCL_jg9954.t1 [Rhizophagus clarus]
MASGAKSVSELISGKCNRVNQCRVLKEKLGKYYEYYGTFKDKLVTFMKKNTGRQNTTVQDESRKTTNVTSSK